VQSALAELGEGERVVLWRRRDRLVDVELIESCDGDDVLRRVVGDVERLLSEIHQVHVGRVRRRLVGGRIVLLHAARSQQLLLRRRAHFDLALGRVLQRLHGDVARGRYVVNHEVIVVAARHVARAVARRGGLELVEDAVLKTHTRGKANNGKENGAVRRSRLEPAACRQQNAALPLLSRPGCTLLPLLHFHTGRTDAP